MDLTIKVACPVVLMLSFWSCADSTPQYPQRPYPFGALPSPSGSGDFALGPFRSPLTVEDAEQILLRTKVFALGEMPPKRQVQAFNVLLDQADAVTRFRRIAAEGRPAGQLYALAALTALEPPGAASLARTLSANDDDVLIYDSDVAGLRRLRDAVALVAARHVPDECRRLRDSTEAHFRGLDSRPPPAGVNGGRPDNR